MARTITIEFLGNARGVQNAANQAGDATDQLGGRFGVLGEKSKATFAAMAAAAAAGGAAIYAGLSEGLQIEAELDRVQASLGLTADKAQEYGDIAGKLYKEAWGESTADVIQSVEAVASSFKGLADGKELEDVTRQALAFSEVFQTDLPESVGFAQSVMNSGLAKSATEAFDLMTRAAQEVPKALRGNINEAADEYGQFFDQLGFSGPEAFGLLVKGAEKGQYGIDKVGDALKEFTIRATDLSTSTDGAYKTLGLNTQEMTNAILEGGDSSRKAFDQIIQGLLAIKDPGKQAAQAIALFGTPVEDLNVGQIPEFLRGLQDGAKGLDGVKGAADEAGAVVGDNLSGKFTALKRTIQMALVDFVTDEVIPAFERFADYIQPAVKRVRDEFAKLRPIMDKVVGFIKDNPDTVKAFAIALGIMAGAWAAVTLATAAWSAVLQTTGIPILILAIAGLVAGLVTAYKKSETFRNAVNGAAEKIKEFAGFIYDNAKPALEAIVEYFKTAAGFTIDIWKGFVDRLREFWSVFGDNIIQQAKGMFGAAKDIIKGFFKTVKGIFKVFSSLLKGDWKGAWKGIKDVVSGAAKMIWGVIKGMFSTLRYGFKMAFTAIREIVSGAFGKMREISKAGLDFVIEKIKDLPGLIKDLGPKMLDAGKAIIGKLFDGLKAMGGLAKNVAGDLMGAIVGAVNAGIQKVNDLLPNKIPLPGPVPDIDLEDNPFPLIPGFAKGTSFAPGGLALVGENGPELVNLPRGSRVHTAAQTAAMAGSLAGGGVTVNINGPVYGDPRKYVQEIRQMLLKEKRLLGTDLGLA